MKKRILSFLLVLGTLLSAFPVLGVAAEETVPKDETPGVVSETLPEGAHSFTDYDALYVGADGSTTANGGSLVGLFTAFGDDATVDIEGGKWKNKMDVTGAKDIILRDESDAISFAKETQGFGYHMVEAELGVRRKLGLTLPAEWADLPGFSVEQSAALDLVESERPCADNDYSCVRLDVLLGMWIPGSRQGETRLTGGDTYCMRWRIGSNISGTGAYVAYAAQEFAYRDAYDKEANKPAGMVTVYTKTTGADDKVSYLISYNTDAAYPSANSFTAAELAAMRAAASSNTTPIFSLLNGMGSTIYAVRVYDAPLTEAERAHNAAVDVMAYAGVDLTSYLSLDANERSVVDGALSKNVFSDDKEAVEQQLEELQSMFGGKDKIQNTLYVTKGLTFFASAYKDLSTGAENGLGTNLEWRNAMNAAQSATLKGGYTANADGGLTIVKTVPEANLSKNPKDWPWSAQSDFGILMPADALPDEDYTVEFVYNPTGLTERGADGELQAHVNQVTTSGNVYHAMSIAIGPLRSQVFSCRFALAGGNNLAKRWYYHPTQDNQSGTDYNYASDFQDNTWGELDLYEVVNYSITHDYTAGSSKYDFYNNAKFVEKLEFGESKYATPDEAQNKFQLLFGMAGTAYSIRVYDRALTEAEVAQNKIADVVYYLGLDAASITDLALQMGDAAGNLFLALKDISFTMSKEEAQEYIAKNLVASWLSYEGLGVRKEADKDGIRYYFGCNINGISAMALGGYTLEVGALVNVNKNTMPELTSGSYDYKIAACDSDAGKNLPFFVDDDTFAVTVRYENADKAASMKNVYVRGYVKMTNAEDETTVFYLDVVDISKDEFSPTNLLNVYDSVKDSAGVKNQLDAYNRIRSVIDRCHETLYIYVDAGASTEGDGSKDTPFRSFAAAFAKSKELLRAVNSPTRVCMILNDGEYGIYENQTLAGTDMPYYFSSFEITSANGKSTLTTTKNINKEFTKHANNVWVCQLDKDASGNYPCFRTLYVDGSLAEISYSVDRYSVDDNPYSSMFEREFDGIWQKAYDLYKNGQLSADTVGYPASRPDLNATFDALKVQFLALKDMEQQYNRGQLTLSSVPQLANPSEDYLKAFNDFKFHRFAYDDLKAQFDAPEAGSNYEAKREALKTFTPKASRDDDYKAKFCELRDYIAAHGKAGSKANWEMYYSPMPKACDSIAEAKYYLHEDVVGDLRAEMTAGKARNEAAYNALLAKYNAASDDEKAELEDDLLLAAEKVADETWRHYALEGYGPEMHLAGQWYANIIHVAGIDYDDTATDKNGDTHYAVYLEKDEYVNYQHRMDHSMVDRYVHMKDALDYVDSESEYYYDELSGKVYYYSESGAAGKTFAHGTNDYMFVFQGVRNVTFSDLTFTGMDDDYLSHNDGCTALSATGATGQVYDSVNEKNNHSYDRSVILLDSCYGLEVYGCNFVDLPTRGIFGKRVLENIVIDSCNFVNLGGGAIQFGDSTHERNWKWGVNHIQNAVVTNNYVHNVAREYLSTAGIWFHYGRNVTVSYNTVDKCSYTAIALGFTYGLAGQNPSQEFCVLDNVEINNNYVTGFMQNIGDGGGIYVSGGNARTDNTEYFNFMHDNYVVMSNATGDGHGNQVCAIYFDGAASNWDCYSNVVVCQSYGAVDGEDDELYEAGDKYVTQLRKRWNGTFLIYLQHINGQITWNIRVRDNYALNIRSSDFEEQLKEVYDGFIAPERNHIVENTEFVTDINYIPLSAEEIIYAAGAYGHEGDPSLLWNNDY